MRKAWEMEQQDALVEQLYNEFKALKVENAKLELSHRRYMWIRDNGGSLITPDRGLGPGWPDGYEVDGLVDAAISRALSSDVVGESDQQQENG